MTELLTPRRLVEPTDRSGVMDRAPAVGLAPAVGTCLLRLARAAIEAVVSGRPLPDPDLGDSLPRPLAVALTAPAAAFVTLHEAGELRGCIGTLDPDQPLWRAVVGAAVAAAVDDARFRPVLATEIPRLRIDVSVLGPAVPLRDLSAFRPGIDGLVVVRGGRRGVLLPEVATDQGWGAVEMLQMTCRKAGLPADAWRDAATEILAFRTARVSDVDVEG